MRIRKTGIKYKTSLKKKKYREQLLKELCRVNYKIVNKLLIEKLGISKTEFYRNYKKMADTYREENKNESLFWFPIFNKIGKIEVTKKINLIGVNIMQIEMLNAKDISQMLNVSVSKASNIIRALNNLKIARGTPKECLIAGKIDKAFFIEECNYKKD